MRKLILLAISACSLAACGSETAAVVQTTAPTANPTQAPTQAPQTPEPTSAPVSANCYVIYQMTEAVSGVSTVFEVAATNPTVCAAALAYSGQTINGFDVVVVSTSALASDAELNCSADLSGSTIKVYDNGTSLSKSAASGFCKGVSGNTAGA